MVDDRCLQWQSRMASISAGTETGTASVSETTTPGAQIVKELAVKVLPSIDARDKEAKTYVVMNTPEPPQLVWHLSKHIFQNSWALKELLILDITSEEGKKFGSSLVVGRERRL